MRAIPWPLVGSLRRGPVMQSFEFLDSMKKLVNKLWSCRWYRRPSCNVTATVATAPRVRFKLSTGTLWLYELILRLSRLGVWFPSNGWRHSGRKSRYQFLFCHDTTKLSKCMQVRVCTDMNTALNPPLWKARWQTIVTAASLVTAWEALWHHSDACVTKSWQYASMENRQNNKIFV